MLKMSYKAVLLFMLCACSKKLQIYCGSGFDGVQTTVAISNNRFSPGKKYIVLQDSILKNNSVIGLSFAGDKRFHAKELRIEISVTKSRFNAHADSTFYYQINKKKASVYIDLLFVRKDSTFNFEFRALNPGETFY